MVTRRQYSTWFIVEHRAETSSIGFRDHCDSYTANGGGAVDNTSDSGSRGWGFEPHSGRRVVFLSKTYLPPKSTGNTQEALAPSQHD